MLFPRPPRPVPRQREVATAVVAHKQRAAITSEHVLQARPDAPVVDPLVAREGAEATPAITLRVVYGLREYLAILREYLPEEMVSWEQARGKAADGRPSWQVRATVAMLVPLVGPPVFWRKKRLMPVCRFSIDAHGIERRAGGGRLAFAWDEVRAVHRLRDAYLINKERGGVPLPYRCFDDAQRAAFERLLQSRFPQDPV